ncbi:TPA: hypothetical protein P0E12_004986 [Vibrio harveyi]|nr:hypothetical protein [Vibrio harveyi]
MLSEIAIIEIDKILELCDAFASTQREIDLCNSLSFEPSTTCQYYEVAKIILENRAISDNMANDQLNVLVALANVDGCEIELDPVEVPDVDIPIFCLGVD